MCKKLIMLKLGGSVVTNKKERETVLYDNLKNLSAEIASAIQKDKTLAGRLIIGHGSGSFGHFMASKYGTRKGVSGSDQWMGFALVSDSALRLNRIVVSNLLEAGIPAISISTMSAATRCKNGKITQTNLWIPIRSALDQGLVPVIHGDVVFDEVIGGTIASTEEIMKFLASHSEPSFRVEKILLAVGGVKGVLDQDGHVVNEINGANYTKYQSSIGGSGSTDVTGGMATKVSNMIQLCSNGIIDQVWIFCGSTSDVMLNHLLANGEFDGERDDLGTLISK